MSILLAYVAVVQILTIVFFKEYNLFILSFLAIPLIILLYNKKWIIFISCILTIMLTALTCFYQKEITNAPKPKPNQTVQGEIISTPIIDGNKLSFTFEIQHQKILVNSYTDFESDLSIFRQRKIGEICLLEGEASKPEPNTNPYLFNYKQYLMNQHIQWVYTVKTTSLSNCIEGKLNFGQMLLTYRHNLTKYVERNFNDKVVGYINALLFGDRTKMSSQTESQYQIVGLVHLLAISGSHISLLSLAIYFILIRVGFTKGNSLMVTILCIISYGYLAGNSASVVRAVCIGVMVCLVRLLKVKIDIMAILIISCIFMLSAHPTYVEDIGFQFSFIASFVLLLTSKKLLQLKAWYTKALFTSSLTQLASLPILLVNFHEISPYSILLNLVFIPYITFIIMPLCLICFFVNMIASPISDVFQNILTVFIYWSDQFLLFCMHLPFIKLTFIHPSKIVIILYFLLISAIFYFMEDEKKKTFFKLSLCGFLILLSAHYFYPYMSPVGKVMFIDVGQGDCILIKLPYNKGNYIIDTGGVASFKQEKWMERKKIFSTGSDILIPILKGEGIRKIDKLIFTHGDYDHIGGGKEILESFPVEQLYVGDKRKYDKVEQERIEIAYKNGTKIQKVSEGFKWEVDGNQFEVLSPIKGYIGEENHGSIVMKAKIGDENWMFTGDLDESGEMRLVSKFDQLQSDILKVGHHGSTTSTSEQFLKAVAPKIAIISVGKNNRYGHPKKEIIDRLTKYNIMILRTDIYGAITYEFKHGQSTIYSFNAYRKSKDKNRKGK